MNDIIPGNIVDVDEYERMAQGSLPPERVCLRCGVEMPRAWTPAPCADCWSNEVQRWESYGYDDAHKRA